MNVIECSNLKKSFKHFAAIDDLSIKIEENKMTGLIGRNGAGKTTLLKLIAGFLRPTSGEIKVFSQDPFNSLLVSANLIYIDNQMLFPSTFTLFDILNSAGSFYPNWDKGLAYKLLDYFYLDRTKSHSSLSKGMQSTFNVILGLAAHCPLTIFDEPTTGMDAAVRKDFYRALLKDYVAHPRTIILSSHLLNEIEDILEDILLLKNGTKCLHLAVTSFKEYALGLRGNASVIHQLIGNRTVIHEEQFARNNVFLVVKHDFSEHQLYELKRSDVGYSSVPTEDLCVYLTSKTKGGIDDVFCRS